MAWPVTILHNCCVEDAAVARVIELPTRAWVLGNDVSKTIFAKPRSHASRRTTSLEDQYGGLGKH